LEFLVALAGTSRMTKHHPEDRGDGRRPDGLFARGNKGGPGNYLGRRTREYREAIYKAVTPKDAADIMRAMVDIAKQGDVAAAKVVFERLMGAPEAMDVTEKLATLEAAVSEFMRTGVMPQVPEDF
jgi:hypothetical protein